MTVHSGFFGPVHTGIVSGIELFVALRLQRRLQPCLLHHFGYGAEQVCSTAVRHHRAAQVWGVPFSHALCCSPCSAGRAHAGFRPPAWALPGSPSSWTTWSTLPRRLRLLGLSGGRWAANDGRAETAVTKEYSFFVEVLIVNWHFHGSHGARFFPFESVVAYSGKEGVKHSGSASAR